MIDGCKQFFESEWNVVVDPFDGFIGRLFLRHLRCFGSRLRSGGRLLTVLRTLSLHRTAVRRRAGLLRTETGISALRLSLGLSLTIRSSAVPFAARLTRLVAAVQELHPFRIDAQTGTLVPRLFFRPLIVDQSSFDEYGGALLKETG